MRASLLDTLDDFERWNGDCACVFPRGYRRERWSYRRVVETAYRFARELDSRNVVKGDAVLLWAPNSAEWIAAFMGCATRGVVVVPVDDAAHPAFAQQISAQVRTRLILCSRERAALFQASPEISTLDPAEFSSALAQHSSECHRPLAVQPSDVLEIVFTSGTTDEPKGVVLTHGNVAGNIAPIAAEIKKYLRYERFVHPLRFLNLLPLSHVFGQFLGIFLPPLLGATVVFSDTLNPAEIISTIRSERVSLLVAVPRMLDSLRQKIERDLADSATRFGHSAPNFSVRFSAAKNQHFLRRWFTFRDIRRRFGWKFLAMVSGGAALNPDTEEFWHRLGYAVIQGYGLTETTSLVSLNHPFHTSHGSIGKVLPGREIKLADDGEILVRGSGVASGYWNGSSSSAQPVTRDAAGWYPTGDLGALDPQGNLFFKGRKKEVIVTPAGMNIYPSDLEEALRRQSQIRDAVVISSERGGNAEPCAVLLLRDPSERSGVREVVERANQTLAEYQHMRSWFVWPDEDFPRTSTQKPRRQQIRETVEASLDGQPSPPATGALAELLTQITGRTPQHLSPDTQLESGLGLSSLERVELIGALEDRYQVDLNELQFVATATVADIEKLLQQESRAPDPLHPLPTNDVQSSDASSRMSPHYATRFHYPRWTLCWPATWARRAALYLLIPPAVYFLGRPRISGRDNLRGVRGPLLIVSNHTANVDIGLIQFALPAPLRHKLAIATAGETLEALRSPALRRPWFLKIWDRLQWFLGVTLLNLFPLPRLSGFRKSFAYAGEAADRGYSILVFPEGHYSLDGSISSFRTGVGLLAANLQIPVLPLRIDGLFHFKQAKRRYTAPGKIHITFGKLLNFDPQSSPEEIARTLQRAVETLT